MFAKLSYFSLSAVLYCTEKANFVQFSIILNEILHLLTKVFLNFALGYNNQNPNKREI